MRATNGGATAPPFQFQNMKIAASAAISVARIGQAMEHLRFCRRQRSECGMPWSVRSYLRFSWVSFLSAMNFVMSFMAPSNFFFIRL